MSVDDIGAMINLLPPHELAILKWRIQRRPEQIAPDPLPLIWFLLGGRGSGKAVDLNTPIPTPDGWVLMGDIQVGQIVFDEAGAQCSVLATYDITPERAYEITFSDHSTIIAGGEHLWATSDQLERKRANRKGVAPSTTVRTTDEIVRTFTRGNRGDRNHSIPLQGALQMEEVDLPVDPWLLGFWLGDGSSASGQVTVSDEDLHSLSHLSLGKPSRKPGANCASYIVLGLEARLRPLGVMTQVKSRKDRQIPGYKHVPEMYLWASERQRLALLQGLMDTDGSADAVKNTVEFCNTNEHLADAVVQLARSLGEKPVKAKGRAKLYGVDCGPKYRVTWRPVNHIPFRLERKRANISPLGAQKSRMMHRMITGIEEVSVRPMRCLTVGSPNHLFLAGEQMVPTHNTKTGANHVFELACTLPWTSKYRSVRIALVGNTYDDVKKIMVEGDSGLLSVIPAELVYKWNRTIGELTVRITEPVSGEEREIIFSSYTATTPDKLRGPQFHIAWCDEPAKFVDAEEDPMARDTTWSNLILGLRLGEQPHLVVTGTPTPCKLVLYLLAHPNITTTKMTTWANREHLPQLYQDELLSLDPNSRMYRQEVMAEVLLDNPDALFSDENINRDRANQPTNNVPFFKVLGYDPSASSSDEADEAGIVLVGYTPEVKARAKLNETGGGRPMIEQHTEAYVLRDLSGHMTPAEQSALVIRTVIEERVSDLIFETNQGADMVVTLLTQAMKDQTADYIIRQRRKRKNTDFGPVKRFDVTVTLDDGTSHKFLMSAITATTNKRVRAETASYQYDYGRVHHPPAGVLPVCSKDACKTSLEYELTTWNPNKTSGRAMSPNRLDALVYALFFVFGRHAMHSNANSKLHMPAPNRAGLREDQKITALDRKRRQAIATIWSVDLGGRPGERRLPEEDDTYYNRNLA